MILRGSAIEIASGGRSAGRPRRWTKRNTVHAGGRSAAGSNKGDFNRAAKTYAAPRLRSTLRRDDRLRPAAYDWGELFSSIAVLDANRKVFRVAGWLKRYVYYSI